jgi:hypothetical protein
MESTIKSARDYELKYLDIEKGIKDDYTSKDTYTKHEIKENDDMEVCCMKFCSIIILYVVCFPFAVCDLYYGYTDHSCVSNPTDIVAINIKYYLIVSGWINISLIFIMSCVSCYCNPKKTASSCCYITSSFISFAFELSWNIIGSVIF